jgi:hypothetical protein
MRRMWGEGWERRAKELGGGLSAMMNGGEEGKCGTDSEAEYFHSMG